MLMLLTHLVCLTVVVDLSGPVLSGFRFGICVNSIARNLAFVFGPL